MANEVVDKPELRKCLSGWQIFFISITAVIGTGIFSYDGYALSLAGPGALLLAIGVVGVIAICFMDGLSEMIQVFPCTNALIEYINFFVDPDLSYCCGWAYWIAWCAVFSSSLISAASFAAAWLIGQKEIVEYFLKIFLFFLFAPVVLSIVNSLNVHYFGIIETFGGLFKLVMISACGLIAFYLGGKVEGIGMTTSELKCNATTFEFPQNGKSFLTDGFTNTPAFPNPASNFFAALPIVTFSWAGLDIVGITAFEARDLRNLRQPSHLLPYIIFVIYMIVGVGLAMSLSHKSTQLAQVIIPGIDRSHYMPENCGDLPIGSSALILVDAALQVGDSILAQVLNGLMIFSALSTANTCLYTASRVLYGLTFKFEPRKKGIRKLLAFVGRVNNSRVPGNAVLVSVALFIWFPFVGFTGTRAEEDIYRVNRDVEYSSLEFLNTVGSSTVLFVWGSQCLAFLRYRIWFKIHQTGLIQKRYPELNRWNPRDERLTSTMLREFQPVIASVGLLGSFLIVFVFPSALWWSRGFQSSGGIAFAVTQSYLAPSGILIAWVCLKIRRWYVRGSLTDVEWYVKLDNDPEKLEEVIHRLQLLSEEQSSNCCKS